jgi:YidC/Oxa1 family membrane protein insertase
MDDQNKNLLLATVLSFMVILVWFVMFPPPEPVVDPNAPVAGQGQLADNLPPAVAGADAPPGAVVEAAPEAVRVPVDTPRLVGSISLTGGRLDDLSLRDYRQTTAPDAEIVRLLRPSGGPNAYYAMHGWAPGGALSHEDVPGPATEWTLAQGTALSTGSPVVLEWDNGKGLLFRRTISVDTNYMFTVAQAVTNSGTEPVRLAPYGLIARHGMPPDLENFFISHEGTIQWLDGRLTENDYDDLMEAPVSPTERVPMLSTDGATSGWLGFGDKYWMTTLIPSAGEPFTAVQKYFPARDVWQTETRMAALTVAPGETASAESRVYAGAKEWAVIRGYENAPGFVARLFGAEVDPNIAPVPSFIDAIDWGWFFFLTKPIFALLHWLNAVIGNMGMGDHRADADDQGACPAAGLQILRLHGADEGTSARDGGAEGTRAGDDRQKPSDGDDEALQEKGEPGLRLSADPDPDPIFFSLYKVIFVTIELRHAPWIGWIRTCRP